MEVDEHGVLTESELEDMKWAWMRQDPAVNYARANRGDYKELMLEAAEAQHDHDVAVVREIEVPNPYLGGGDSFSVFWQGLSDAKKAILAALKAKAENAG